MGEYHRQTSCTTRLLPVLFQALTRMRLANASNLGVSRVYRDLLREGKEPPDYWSSGGAVRVTIKGQEARREFLDLVNKHPGLDVDDLLVLHFLTRHREITARATADICQRSLEGARETLAKLVTEWSLLEPGGGAGRGRYHRLSRDAYSLLVGALSYRVDRRLAAEDAKGRVLSALSEGSLSNAEIREITRFTRYQAVRLMSSLRKEGWVEVSGSGRNAHWFLCAKSQQPGNVRIAKPVRRAKS